MKLPFHDKKINKQNPLVFLKRNSACKSMHNDSHHSNVLVTITESKVLNNGRVRGCGCVKDFAISGFYGCCFIN